MANSNHKQSAIGTFGSVFIVLSILFGLVKSNVYIAAEGVAAGIFIILIACIVDRLDIIIDLLRQIGEHMPSTSDEQKDSSK